MKKTIIFLLLIMLIFSVSSCKKTKVIYAESYTIYQDVKYGSYKRNYIDIYIPKQIDYSGCIFAIHGGAWVAGDKSGYVDSLKNYAENNHIICAALNYHYISKKFGCDVILNDITMALNKLYDFLLDKGITCDKCLLTGGSAGGHLSLLYGYKCFDSAKISVAAIDSWAGPVDLRNDDYYKPGPNIDSYYKWFGWLTCTKINESTLTMHLMDLLEVSPINYVSSSSVPTIINHGEKDSVVPYSEAIMLDEALTRLNVVHELISFPNSDHGCDQDPEIREYSSKLFLSYLDKYLS